MYSTAGSRRRTASQSGRPSSAASTHSGRPSSQSAGAPQLYAAVVQPIRGSVVREDSARFPESLRHHELRADSRPEDEHIHQPQPLQHPGRVQGGGHRGCIAVCVQAFTKPLRKEHLDGINKLLDTKFTPEDMEYIYTNLGNGINHELCMKFVKSGYDLKVIEESV